MEKSVNYSQMAASYRTANETVQKTRQIVLLYDAVIRFLQQSKQAIEAQEYEKRMHLLQKASNIVMGLSSALDFENGGEISEMLGNFYNAMDLRILSINRTNDIEDLEKILREIRTMRDAWYQIDNQAKAESLEAAFVAPAPIQEPEIIIDTLKGSDFSA